MSIQTNLRPTPGPRRDELASAIRVIADQLRHLPVADQGDLFELLPLLSSTPDGPDRDEILATISEILSQTPASAIPLPDLPAEAPGLRAWTERVGARIRELRKQANLTQNDLAARTGIGQAYLSRIERAEHSPSHKTLARIAEALDVELDQIDSGEE